MPGLRLVEQPLGRAGWPARSFSSMSKANTATSIAPITLVSERRRLDRFGSLPLQRVAERVDLLHHEIGGAAGLGAGPADRVVPFVQRAEQIGGEVEHARDHLVRRQRAADPDDEDDGGERPADLEAVVLAPDDPDQRDRRRQPAEQRQADDGLLEAPMDLFQRSPAAAARRCPPAARLGSLRDARSSQLAPLDSPLPATIRGRHIAAAAGRGRCGSCRAARTARRTSPLCRARTFSMNTRSASSSERSVAGRRRRRRRAGAG